MSDPAAVLSERTRLVWVDNAKAIAICLIVLGHTQKLIPDGVIWFVYAFHVPVFLLATGVLLPSDPLRNGFNTAIQRRVNPLVRYYFFFSAISGLLYWLRNVVSGGPTDFLRLVWGIVYGSVGSDVFGYSEGIIHENRPLWYFPFLVSSLVILLLCLRLGRVAQAVVMTGLMLASIYLALLFRPSWPWALDVAGVGAFFLFLGWTLRDGIDRAARARPKLIWLIPILLMSFAITWMITSYNGPMNINGRLFGRVPPLAILAACLGCSGMIALSLLLPETALLQRLSKHTLVIFVVHKYPLGILEFLARKTVPQLLWMPAGIVISLLVTYACLLLSERISPWLMLHVARRSA